MYDFAILEVAIKEVMELIEVKIDEKTYRGDSLSFKITLLLSLEEHLGCQGRQNDTHRGLFNFSLRTTTLLALDIFCSTKAPSELDLLFKGPTLFL